MYSISPKGSSQSGPGVMLIMLLNVLPRRCPILLKTLTIYIYIYIYIDIYIYSILLRKTDMGLHYILYIYIYIYMWLIFRSFSPPLYMLEI